MFAGSVPILTEDEWQLSDDSLTMLQCLHDKVSERKVRLFASACCRQVGPFAEAPRARRALDVADLYADGQASGEELQLLLFGHDPRESGWGAGFFAEAVAGLLSPYDLSYLTVPGHAARARRDVLRAADWSCALREQAHILRDVTGYLYHPLVVTPTWLFAHGGDIVRQLAQAIYQDRTFADLPILADALEDTGCTDGVILDHLRGPGPHARGCWVLDLILQNA